MLLGGAVGKSAQLPLQTWLPDAMAGPTPVSALIHAATMVTAGVYLIARTHGLFELAPAVLQLTGEIGAITLVLAGFAALVQTDIKRVLAYSTMSQIGYMFLALGAGAWQAAIFHLMSHAFFKALLFLTSGAVILACHHEQDIFKMGGLWKKLPLEYACFLVGGAALSALPFVTIGYYSKDAILEQALLNGHPGLVAAGLFGALMTGLYTFRMIFIVFHGRPNSEAHAGHGIAWGLPLVVLLVLSTAIGALIHPPTGAVLPAALEGEGSPQVKMLGYIAAAASVSGILLAALLYLGRRRLVDAVAVSLPGRVLTGLWKNAWGFDWLYDWLLVKPFQGLVYLLRGDLFDKIIGLIPKVMSVGNRLLGYTQNGKLRWYAATLGAGAAILLFFIIL
jgi:NADH-quinone oxidoreductase subunit L